MSLLEFLSARKYTGAAKIHVAPHIPPKLLDNALTAYGLRVDPTEVVILIDDTVFGSGKDGCLIGPELLAIKEIFTDSVAYAFSEIDEIEVKGNKLFLDDEKVISFNVPDKKDIKECFDLISHWLCQRATHPTSAPAQHTPPPAEPASASANAAEIAGTDVQAIVQQIVVTAERLGLQRVYVRPHIPPKKLQAALASYGSGMTADDVFVLVDDTLFGGAKEGLLIGRNTLALKMVFEAPRTFFWKYMTSVSVSQRDLYVNGRKIGNLTQLSEKELKGFFSGITAALGAARQAQGNTLASPAPVAPARTEQPVVDAPVSAPVEPAVATPNVAEPVVRTEVSQARGEIPPAQKTTKDKLFDYIATAIEQNKSKILPYLKEKTGEASLAALRNDENIEKLAGVIYTFLPGVVRMALKEQVFVQFVLANRDKILDKLIQAELERAAQAPRLAPPSAETDLDDALNALFEDDAPVNDETGAAVLAWFQLILDDLRNDLAEDPEAALVLQMPISCLEALMKRAGKIANQPKADVEQHMLYTLSIMHGFSFHKAPEDIRQQEEVFKAFFMGMLMVFEKYKELNPATTVDTDAECMPMAFAMAKMVTKEQLNTMVRSMLTEFKNDQKHNGFDVDDLMLLLREANGFAVQWVDFITREALQEERELQRKWGDLLN